MLPQSSRFLFPRSCHPVRCTTSAAGQAPVDSRHPNGSQSSRTDPLLSSRSAFIRMTKFINSPADAFAIIRATERKYGAITEFRFLRDFETRTRYQNMISVAFRDPQSARRISPGLNVLRIPMPQVVPERPGGIGLDELEGLLERQEYVEEVTIPVFGDMMENMLQGTRDETNGNFIECDIRRSKSEFFTMSHSTIISPSRRVRDAIARSFIDWGGFYDIKPIEKSVMISNEDLFGASHIDHIRMRHALRRWSDIGNLPNPYEYTLGSEQTNKQDLRKADDHIEWEPLPGYDSVPEDVPVPIPSSVEVTSQPLYPPPIVPSPLSVILDDPISAPFPTPAYPEPELSDNSPLPPVLPDDVQPEALSPSAIPAQSSSPIIGNQNHSGVSSNSLQNKKTAQLKAARNLVKRAQQQQKKQIPTKPLNSKPTSPVQHGKFTRPPPAGTTLTVEEQNYIVGRLRGFFKGWI